MRIAYITQKVLNTQKPAGVNSGATITPVKSLKSDSINFTGKANYAQELLDLVKGSKKLVFDDFNSYKQSEQMAIHLVNEVKYFFKKYNVSTYLGFGPEKTKYQLNELRGVKSKTYNLKQDEFEDLMSNVKDSAIPKILKNIKGENLTEANNVSFESISHLLTYIGLGMNNGGVKHSGSRAYQSAVEPLLSEEFKLLNYNNLSVKLQNNAGSTRFGIKIGNSRINLNDKEVEKFKQVFAVIDALRARYMLDMQETVRNLEAQRMNQALAEFNRTKPYNVKLLDEKLSSALSALTKY